MMKLLPQDVHLLVMKWTYPDHFPIDDSLGPQKWRTEYERRLEQTIAEWLAQGLIAYQFPQRRMHAFVPIAHLIGTSRDIVTYLDSLIEIANELQSVNDPQYGLHPNKAFPDQIVSLGNCFANAVGKAAEILACRLGEDDAQQEQCFQALVDALVLIQAIKPCNSTTVLHSIWKALHSEKSGLAFHRLARQYPWVIEHRLVLALYPVCHISPAKEVEHLINEIDALLKGKDAPRVLLSDLQACNNMIHPPVSALVPTVTKEISVSRPGLGTQVHPVTEFDEYYPDILRERKTISSESRT